ncbi:hypothetical protein JA1_003723 [Spathaspora sp. JA1]|nr:hypothetical protein JA1_003723 [Spathaspora sp. JA1]
MGSLGVTNVEDVITYIQELLGSIPFEEKTKVLPLLGVYKISHYDLIQLNNYPEKFPIDGNKLLKLGISLGNLLKTLEAEKEAYQRQQMQQQVFVRSLNKSRGNNKSRHPISEYDPFKEDVGSESRLKRESGSSDGTLNGTALPYQVRFMVNLLSVLKSFDIRTPPINKPETFRYNSMSHLQSYGHSDAFSTRDSIVSNNNPSKTPPPLRPSSFTSESSRAEVSPNSSPIKLSSRQLSIEKLEININVDNIFIYKIVLKIICEIFISIKEHMESQGIAADSIPKNDLDESYSIFSSNTINSSDSTYLGNDEYVRVTHQVMKRISSGILEPFVVMLFQELAEHQIRGSFTTLINSL